MPLSVSGASMPALSSRGHGPAGESEDEFAGVSCDESGAMREEFAMLARAQQRDGFGVHEVARGDLHGCGQQLLDDWLFSGAVLDDPPLESAVMERWQHVPQRQALVGSGYGGGEIGAGRQVTGSGV